MPMIRQIRRQSVTKGRTHRFMPAEPAQLDREQAGAKPDAARENSSNNTPTRPTRKPRDSQSVLTDT
jgi:hypothetical protein